MAGKKPQKIANGTSSTNGHAIYHKDASSSYLFTLGLVFGGCCSNAWTLEKLLMHDSSVGSALTVLQLCFVVIYYLPTFLHFQHNVSYLRWLPQLERPTVSLQVWGLQVLVLASMNLFNNWTFVYKIPLTLQIIFRSSGLAVSMIFGYLFLDKRYTSKQIFSVILVSSGVAIATLSRPAPSVASDEYYDASGYFKGIIVMTASLFLAGILGTLQEKTYHKYGPTVWKEGLFYTHALALPVYLAMSRDVWSGLSTLARHAKVDPSPIPAIYITVAINVVAQVGCISGVNRLASSVSSVQTNLILTARKALSLILSVLLGNQWNKGLGLGGVLVAVGTVMYSWRVDSEKDVDKKRR